MTPSSLLIAADAGTVAAFGLEELGVAGVAVAPAQVGADRSAERGVVGVVAVGDDELAQRPEVRLDRVRPRRVGRGEHQLDVCSPRTTRARRGSCGGSGCRGSRGSARRRRRGPGSTCNRPQRRRGAFRRFDRAPQLGPRRPSSRRRAAGTRAACDSSPATARGLPSGAHADPPTGLIVNGPNSSNANVRSRACSSSHSIRASFCSLSGIRRLLPGLGPLERDALDDQDLTQPLPADTRPCGPSSWPGSRRACGSTSA